MNKERLKFMGHPLEDEELEGWEEEDVESNHWSDEELEDDEAKESNWFADYETETVSIDDGVTDDYTTNIDGLDSCKLTGIDDGGEILASKLSDMRVDGSLKITTNVPKFEFSNIIFEPGAQLVVEGDLAAIVFTDCGFSSDFALDVCADCVVETEGYCYFTDTEDVDDDESEEEESSWGIPIAALALATLATSLGGRKKVQVVKEEVVEK